jgi:hypothetical protein
MSNRSWLRGTAIRKGTTTPTTRSHTPQTQSNTAIVFSGGVKDASGRTSEFFVRVYPHLSIMSTDCKLVYGRPVSRMQIRQILESKTTAARQLLLPQDVSYTSSYIPFTFPTQRNKV